MQNRLYGKKAQVSILVILVIVSLVDVVLRGTLFRDTLFTTANLGEPLASVILATMLIVLSFKGKDRIYHILCGAWLSYFILKQLFDLPGAGATLASMIKNSEAFTPEMISIAIRIIIMLCILGIGALFVKYMNEKSIHNRAFNILCIITVLINLGHAIMMTCFIFVADYLPLILAILNNITCTIMVFLFTFFAYDSAKEQHQKTNQ